MMQTSRETARNLLWGTRPGQTKFQNVSLAAHASPALKLASWLDGRLVEFQTLPPTASWPITTLGLYRPIAGPGYIFRDGSCLDCVARPPLTGKVSTAPTMNRECLFTHIRPLCQAWKQLVLTVEKIARGSDHIRIDVFVPGGTGGLFGYATQRVGECY